MRPSIRAEPPKPISSITPRPADVRQPAWTNICYVLASFQAIAARHPHHLVDMLEPYPGGVRVRHYGVNRAIPINDDSPQGPRFVPGAQLSGHTCVCDDKPVTTRSWVAVLQRAYLTTRGANVRQRGYPENVLHWALGCRVQTGILYPGPARAIALAHLAQMFVAGECVVFFVGTHCWSLVGATMQATHDASAWRLTLSDPRGWRRTFTVFSNASRAMRGVYAYSVTMGAASRPCVPAPAKQISAAQPAVFSRQEVE